MSFFNAARLRAGRSSLCMLAAGVILTGCAGLAPVRSPVQAPGTSADISADTTARSVQPKRPYHPAIEIAGRLSLRYEHNGAEQAIDGKFSWNQARDDTRITLLTPFGQTLATIEITPAGSVLRQANQPPRSAANVDALTAETLGWPLPVAGLRDWLQGFAADERGRPYVGMPDAAGDAAYVKTADGWLIHYPAWEDAATAAARPKRIDLQRQTAEAGKVALRIVIDQWQPQG